MEDFERMTCGNHERKAGMRERKKEAKRQECRQCAVLSAVCFVIAGALLAAVVWNVARYDGNAALNCSVLAAMAMGAGAITGRDLMRGVFSS